jgi:hypothetical protein
MSTDRTPSALVLSPDHVPLAGLTPAGQLVTWFANDTEVRYRQAPHPDLGPGDVSYRFNRLGYRGEECPPVKPPGALTLLSVGASEVFGLGVAEEDAFPSLLARDLAACLSREVISVNLGLCGGSMDYVSRVMSSAITAVSADVVVFVVPSPVRREHVSDDGRRFLYPNSYSSTWWGGVKNRFKYQVGDPESAQQNRAWRNLSSDANDSLNCFRNYATCEMLCRRHQVRWVFSSFFEAYVQPIRHLVDERHHVTPGLADLRNQMLDQRLDAGRVWARDMGHPGVEPHRRMAHLCLERLQQLYGPDLAFSRCELYPELVQSPPTAAMMSAV